ncbi:hypothetical protein TNIN_128461 [Trichonephila inaurata madagascariensis]|uniref:Uncharacterized protein n=1 Tax=Trichonephila inaurata madagascariensis TaxID=2747483 RepID=A0A8X6K3F3_9ARAC|nr:hypothetical protein TNIN_128461 [Trichonephila inaurata madagascariensis]
MQQLLPNLHPRDIPTFESFAYIGPADVFHEYLEQEATKGKGAFIKAVWNVIGKSKLYNLVHRAWTEQRDPPDTAWMKLAQTRCWMGATGRNGPIACFKCPSHAPSASLPYIGHRERSVAKCFIRDAFRNTWTFTTPVPSAERS